MRAISEEKKTLYIFIVNDPSYTTKVSDFKKLLSGITDPEIDVLLVSKTYIKPAIQRYVNESAKKKITFKCLLFDNFVVDVRESVLVPKHYLCTSEEQKNIMQENNIPNASLFPRIKHTDPQVIWCNGKVGQMIKIIRNDHVGQTLYYRIIV